MIKMKIIILSVICMVLPLITAFHSKKFEKHTPSTSLKKGTFVTKLDHFRPQDDREVIFNYHLNDVHLKPFGPIFIYINDLGQFTTKWIEQGLMADIAIEVDAALLTYNIRYYGDNIPTETASYDDMQYATVGQSVSDIAYLITKVKEDLNDPSAKIILYGSGFGAKLATYARSRFPHLVDGVWASSGVYQPEATPVSFYNLLSWNIHQHGEENCDLIVKSAFDIMEYLIEHEEEEFVHDDFNLCDAVDSNSTKDIAMFFENQIKFISDYVDNYHIQGILNFCRDMKAIIGDGLNSFARWVRFVYGDLECFDFNYEKYVKQLQNESWHQPGTDSGNRQTLYLQCTELGYLKMTSYNSLFPNRINRDYLFGLCVDVFGERYRVPKLVEATRALNIQFGSKDQRITNVLYTNGMLDSWVDHAIVDDNFPGSHVINMLYSAKSADLDSIIGWESIEVNFAKTEVKRLVNEWIVPIPK